MAYEPIQPNDASYDAFNCSILVSQPPPIILPHTLLHRQPPTEANLLAPPAAYFASYGSP